MAFASRNALCGEKGHARGLGVSWTILHWNVIKLLHCLHTWQERFLIGTHPDSHNGRGALCKMPLAAILEKVNK